MKKKKETQYPAELTEFMEMLKDVNFESASHDN